MIDNQKRVFIAFTGSDERSLLKALKGSWLFPEGLPKRAQIADENFKPPPEDWFERSLCTDAGLHVRWPGKGLVVLSWHVGTIIKLQNYVELDISTLFELIRGQEWSLMSTSSLYMQWEKPDGSSYQPPGFADRHYSHGWACAFKGAGHNRLVSRRWLEHGPWRLIRDEESDLSFIQFHDLEADAETALEQARVGHERMGISDTGGFLQTDYVWRRSFSGSYVPSTRTYHIVVVGRDVDQREMMDACALVHYQKLGPEEPLENIAYVFPEEKRARAHLHELWLRGLECWAIVDGEKVRLDTDYQPEVKKPQWVLDVEAREAAQS